MDAYEEHKDGWMLKMRDRELENLLNYLARQEEFVFLDTSRPDDENHESLLFCEPKERMICSPGDDLEEYLDALQRRLADGFYLAGWVSYEFGVFLEGRIDSAGDREKQSHQPLADLAVFDKPLRFDHLTGASNFPAGQENNVLMEGYRISSLRPNMEKEHYLQALAAVQQYIAAGDTYQVNYTMKLLFDFTGSAERLYFDLRRNQSVAYGAYIRNGEERTLSFSPELFFRKKGDEITVRPMKGTASRGRNTREEEEYKHFLRNDVKNRSENVMIVDLLRNDLGRLMHGHGQSRVYVESLFDVESYESLLQMTSTIKARSATATMRELQLTELFRALFPCGSITGAPKIRTMQIINELESDTRGVYTGAIGYFGPDGSAVFNVPIRTIRLQGGVGEMGIGGGIVHDSVPEEEWQESLLKGRFLTHAQPQFQLFETLLWNPGEGYWLLEEHLERLLSGARFFMFSCDPDSLRHRLEQVTERFGTNFHRVKLLLEKDGRVAVEAKECEQPRQTELPPVAPKEQQEGLPLIDFWKQPVDTDNPWLFHKTTLRQRYDNVYHQAVAEGLFDYIFCNEEGEVTEGCISNIVIYRDGTYITPPVACGLLPGVMRRQLLEKGAVEIVEQAVGEEDVRSAEAVFLCNSVRGVVQVQLR